MFMLCVLAGVIVTLTIAQNGQLAGFYGDYSAAVIIHATGLVAALLFCFCTRKRLPKKQAAKPWMFLGGVIGVATVVFTTTAYGGVSVTAIVGLGLLGQSLSSIVVDHFGLMGAKKTKFFPKRLIGVAAVLIGSLIMLFPLGETSWFAALLALASGVTIVTARTINGQLAKRHGPMRSTVMNYVTGLITTTIIMLLIGRGEPAWMEFKMSSNVFMYLGGLFGVCLIQILNITVNKVSAFALTLLQFTGQIFTGLALDAITLGSFSWQSAVGGVLVALGLYLDVTISKKHEIQLENSALNAEN